MLRISWQGASAVSVDRYSDGWFREARNTCSSHPGLELSLPRLWRLCASSLIRTSRCQPRNATYLRKSLSRTCSETQLRPSLQSEVASSRPWS